MKCVTQVDVQLRQIAATHEVSVDSFCGLAALGNSPHDQGLAATHIARSEHSRLTAHIVRTAFYVPALIEL